jgi:hypothetical protein
MVAHFTTKHPVSTADSESVLGVLTIGTYYCCRAVTTRLTKSLLPYKFYTHTKARNWVSRDSGTNFRNFFGKKIIKILLTCYIIQGIYTIKEYTKHERIIRI